MGNRNKYKPKPSANKIVNPNSKETYTPTKTEKGDGFTHIKPKTPEMPKKVKPKPKK